VRADFVCPPESLKAHQSLLPCHGKPSFPVWFGSLGDISGSGGTIATQQTKTCTQLCWIFIRSDRHLIRQSDRELSSRSCVLQRTCLYTLDRLVTFAQQCTAVDKKSLYQACVHAMCHVSARPASEITTCIHFPGIPYCFL
jgi:hypothetical protein